MTSLPFITTTEAASLLGVHDATIRRMCETGELKAQFERGIWFIDRRSAIKLELTMGKRQERIARERAKHTERITQIVKTCPRCGLKVRGTGAYANHRTACKRLFRQLEEESEPDEWRPNTDEYDPQWLRRLRKEAA